MPPRGDTMAKRSKPKTTETQDPELLPAIDIAIDPIPDVDDAEETAPESATEPSSEAVAEEQISPRPVAIGESLCPFFAQEIKSVQKFTGRHDLLAADASEYRRYGVEIPSLALQYVCQSNVLFMESLTLLAGPAASHKSSFAFEVARWVIEMAGFARLFNTEGGKYNPKLPIAVIGRARINDQSWQVIDCDSTNQWQGHLAAVEKAYRKFYKYGVPPKKGETPVPLMPVVIAIDSLTGKGTEKSADYFDKKGESANTQGATVAKSISDFLQNRDFSYLPWFVIMIRHEKEGKIGETFKSFGSQKSTPGGKAPDFLGGYDFRFSLIERYRERADYQYNVVRIVCNKNAFGADKSRCEIRFSWTWEQSPNNLEVVEQIPRWEWDLATAQFLANYDYASIKDICHVVAAGTKAEPTFSCKQLGLKGVSGDVLGAAVRQDAQIYAQLQSYLHINTWPTFDPNMEIPRGD